jgi:hypothetical protein
MSGNNYVIDSDENSDYMYNIIKKVLEEVGPRAPCSENERKASEMMAEELKNKCESVDIEEFQTYPRALHGWVKIAVALVIIGFMIYLLRPFNSFIISTISLLIILFVLYMVFKHLFLYDEFIMKYWPLFKKETSQNVVGTMKPKGEVKKRVIFSGHIDSTPRFDIMHYFRDGYMYSVTTILIFLVLLTIFYLIQFILSIFELFPLNISLIINVITIGLNVIVIILPWLFVMFFIVLGKKGKVFMGVFKHMEPMAYVLILGIFVYQVIIEISLFSYLLITPTILKTTTILFLYAIPVLFLEYFMFTNKKHAVPGALDNLSAVAPVMCIAKVLKDWKDNNSELYPNNTEVKIVITGCEENGCRGAEQFALKHADEYNAIDTTVVNMDTMSESRIQGIFNKEGLQDFPPEINDILIECCNDLDYKYSIGPMSVVAGGTDARGFMKYGLRASSLIGLNNEWYHHWYHTDRDNLDLVNKERRPLEDGGTSWKNFNVRGAMEMALKICLKYLEKKDKE